MNYVDLTSEEISMEPINAKLPQNKFHSIKREDDELRAEPKVISQYEWIQIESSNPEFDYLKAFQQRHVNDKLDYKRLDAEILDPNHKESSFNCSNIAERLSKSLSKDGLLKAKKKNQDDYDLHDSFVDDSGSIRPTMAIINQLTPTFEDFACVSGDIGQFKKSNYFAQRLKVAATKTNQDAKKPKSKENPKIGKKSGKDIRKRPEEISRPPQELKKVKITQATETTTFAHINLGS